MSQHVVMGNVLMCVLYVAIGADAVEPAVASQRKEKLSKESSREKVASWLVKC